MQATHTPMTAHTPRAGVPTPSPRAELYRLVAAAIVGLLSGRQLHDLRVGIGCTWTDSGAPVEPLVRWWMDLAGDLAAEHVSRRAAPDAEREARRQRAAALLGVNPTSPAVPVFVESQEHLLRLLLQTQWPWVETIACELPRHGRLDCRGVLSMRPEAR